MKICFSTLGCMDYSFDAIISLAKDYGIDAIEVRGIGGVLDNLEIPEFSDAAAEKTKKVLSDAGIRPLVLGTSCSFHSAVKREEMICTAKANILIAEKMGFPYIRVFGNNLTEDKEECFARVGSALCEVSDFALEHNVTVLLEIHGDYNSIENVSPILDAVGSHRGFGIIWDIAHSDKVYGESWEGFYELIRPYIKHVHVKDHSDAGLTQIGYGKIPILPITKRLLADGYDGYFSLEWEKKWHPEIGDIEPALDKLTELYSKL